MREPCRLLVIDDDPDVLDVVRMILEDEGHEVVTAANGQVALDLLRCGLCPHVILLDLRMPIMDGWHFEAERRKLQLAAGAALVIISSEPTSASAQLAPAAVLRKPLDASVIAASTKLLCEQRH